ncbi:hypothetical protein FOA52_006434 [Chlamydomonas sp. UWO 241]|nr:hypothetical protein FOA52_006434 [Chlamydomonas sp. UWO 241]
MHHRLWCAIVIAALLLLLRHGSAKQQRQQQGKSELPHVSECNYCVRCVVDGPPPVPVALPDLAHAISEMGEEEPGQAQSISGVQISGTDANATARAWALRRRFSHWLHPQPDQMEAKAKLPNCTVCRGCDTHLESMTENEVAFLGVKFRHRDGSTNSRVYYARVNGDTQRYIVKVFCIPLNKRTNVMGSSTCSVRQASERVELLLAQQKLLQDCGIAELSPRVWVAPVIGVTPESGGFHVHWHGLWMEEANGITLDGLARAQKPGLAMRLLQEKLNRTRVQAAAVFDLLTSQCDRHPDNVFVDDRGNIQVIDNDKALGVVERCSQDTIFIPGTRYHSVMRVGFRKELANYYRKIRRTQPDLCHGLVNPSFVMDYRCTTPSGTLGTSYPPSLGACMRRIAEMSDEGVATEYGISHRARVQALRMRATEMMDLGFEAAFASGERSQLPRFTLPHQPQCCGLRMAPGMLTCETCWQPLLPENLPGSNGSTDLQLVTAIIDRQVPDA